MINKDTILSVYTDKQTLLEYLTKIETALDKAVLTSSQLVYEGGNNYHFKFVFEDGSSIETPSITLVQPISKVDFVANGNSAHFVFTLMDGETITTQTINLLKPVTAAAVRDGILYLTLSDGTEVNAGSITASFGATTFNGDVLIHGNFHQTDGNAIFGGNAEVDGNLQVNGNQTEVGNVSITGDSSVSGTSMSKNVKVTENCDAGSFGKKIPYSGAYFDIGSYFSQTIEVLEDNSYKVGNSYHFHFVLKLIVNDDTSNRTYVTGIKICDGFSRYYRGQLALSKVESPGESDTIVLNSYNLYKDGRINFYLSDANKTALGLVSGNALYLDFNQTINF